MTAIRGEGKYRGPIQVRQLTRVTQRARAAATARAGLGPKLQSAASNTHAPSARPSCCPPPQPRTANLCHAQVQSNALAALEAVDPSMSEEVMAAGCVTGDRVNGLCDGLTGDWYCKFDTFHPAVDRGLPVTRVISRVELQQISARYAVRLGGEEVLEPSSTVQSYEEFTNEAGAAPTCVTAPLETQAAIFSSWCSPAGQQAC